MLVLGLMSACGTDQPQEEQKTIAATGDPEIDQVSQQLANDPENADLYALRAEIFYEKNKIHCKMTIFRKFTINYNRIEYLIGKKFVGKK